MKIKIKFKVTILYSPFSQINFACRYENTIKILKTLLFFKLNKNEKNRNGTIVRKRLYHWDNFYYYIYYCTWCWSRSSLSFLPVILSVCRRVCLSVRHDVGDGDYNTAIALFIVVHSWQSDNIFRKNFRRKKKG